MLRSGVSAFTCPTCSHANYNPIVETTDGGTDIVVCDQCGQQVSRRLIADHQDRAERARRKMINEWAGWGVDVV
jgi:transcription elongation factor Elf1